MSLFAIGDLHLSGAKHKPMDIFGSNWFEHEKRIAENWRSAVKESDTVLIPGDISWAMRIEDVKCDLDFINDLPGRKVLIRGNHDYWWSSISHLNAMYENMTFLQNDFVEYNGIAICGSRGWILPDDSKFTAKDLKTYNREQIRFKLSLEGAVKKGYDNILFMMHFPPLIAGTDKSAFMDILKEYPVSTVIYGHLHGRDNFNSAISGLYNGTEFRLVSADYLNFCPIKILD